MKRVITKTVDWVVDKINGRNWIYWADQSRKCDMASLKEDAKLLIELIECGEDRDKEGTATYHSFYYEAVRLARMMAGHRTRPTYYSPTAGLWQRIFGVKCPSIPRYAGKRPDSRIYELNGFKIGGGSE